ncbi:MAG: SDR family NAD(P)-dependent oxidoreductase [bacterium]
MELGLKNKVVGITGGADGIGLATARQMAAEGCRLMLCDINDVKLQETAAELAGQGVEVLARRVDVTKPQEVSAFVAEGQARFGTVDIWVNNAGIYPQKALVEMSVEEWNRLLAVNLTSVLICIQAVSAVMKKAGGGVIVNAASFAGLVPSAGSGGYAATKAAVLSLTRTFAAELAVHGIRVVSYAPGVIETPMTRAVVDARREALENDLRLSEQVCEQERARARYLELELESSKSQIQGAGEMEVKASEQEELVGEFRRELAEALDRAERAQALVARANSESDMMAERLKVAESRLNEAQMRADDAERRSEQFGRVRNEEAGAAARLRSELAGAREALTARIAEVEEEKGRT